MQEYDAAIGTGELGDVVPAVPKSGMSVPQNWFDHPMWDYPNAEECRQDGLYWLKIKTGHACPWFTWQVGKWTKNYNNVNSDVYGTWSIAGRYTPLCQDHRDIAKVGDRILDPDQTKEQRKLEIRMWRLSLWCFGTLCALLGGTIITIIDMFLLLGTK